MKQHIKRVSALVMALVASVALGVASAPAAHALTTTLTFDEFTTSQFIPATQYASEGVLFNRIGGGDTFVFASEDPSVLVDPNGGPFSTPSMLCGNNPANVGVEATFVNPVSSVTVNVSSGPGPDLLSSNVVLTAYDAANNVIATDPADLSQQFDTLSVSAPGIVRVEMPAGGDLDCYDDFTFGDAVNTPATKNDCKHGGWMLYTDENGDPFRNQGQCVSWVNHNT